MMFVRVADSIDSSCDSVEIPVESEGHILMSTLTAQFPGACGLKYKTEQASWRGLRVVDDKIYPTGEDKWSENTTYVITFPKDSKRKGDDLDINSAKSRKIEKKCVDLIVLGLPWKTTEDAVKSYFESNYGEVVLCDIKRDGTNHSKGFGFVRFKHYENQCSVLGKKHYIDGRWCDVKIPNSQEPESCRKIFVGRLSENINTSDLNDYFSKYGQVIDVYIPRPFRAFGFVTFVEADIAQGLCGESHIIKGCSVHVSKADPKEDDSSQHSYASFSHHNNYNASKNYHQSTSPFQNQSNLNAQANPYKIDRTRSNSDQTTFHNRSKPTTGPNSRGKSRYDEVGRNSSNNTPLNSLSNSGEQMNSMMNMFNPMMAAFLQQLATQSNMAPGSGPAGQVGMPTAARDGRAPPAQSNSMISGPGPSGGPGNSPHHHHHHHHSNANSHPHQPAWSQNQGVTSPLHQPPHHTHPFDHYHHQHQSTHSYSHGQAHAHSRYKQY